MIYFIVPIQNKKIVEKNLIPSLEKLKKHKELILVDGDGVGICTKYNVTLDKLKDRINDDDIIIFCHDDIVIHDELFMEKVEMYFKHKPKIALAGVIGANTYHKKNAGGWWTCNRGVESSGSIIQGSPDKESYGMNDKPGMYDNLVIVDGCIMLLRGSVAKTIRFDSETFKDYHFYDSDFCFSILSKGYSIGTISVKVEHKSEGNLPSNWDIERDKFLKKWDKLPEVITVNSFI